MFDKILITFVIIYLIALSLQTEQSYKKNPKALDQFQYCETNGIPLALIIGQSEIENNFVKLRNIATRAEVSITENVIC